MKDAIAIIPARGGSKGLPRKNLRLVAGKPLIAWNIEAALAAKTISQVFVSTDDVEIAEIAQRFGAVVVLRPSEISGDAAPSESALLHVLEKIRPDNQKLLVFLQCTSPLTMAEDIDGTVQRLLDEKADSALAVSRFHYFVWRETKNGAVDGINHDKQTRPRRQDRESQWLETGAVYAMRIDGFREHRHRFFGKTVAYEMPADRVLEIDEEIDLQHAELRLRERIQSNQLAALPQHVAAIIFDFDGVFTDNHVMLDQNGIESVRCDRSDGYGIAQLRAAGVPMVVISAETNPVTAARCGKLQIECISGCKDKLPALRSWLSAKKIDSSNTIYLGNDLNDLDCMHAVGCGVAVADAHRDLLPAARIVLNHSGGHRAVRELCDLVLRRNHHVAERDLIAA